MAVHSTISLVQSPALLALVASFAAGTAAAGEAPPAPRKELVARAVAYEHGEGVPKDLSLAVQLYCEAARAGDAEAQFGLGWMYANGRGVAHDDAVAGALFELAAAQGHTHAQRMLQFVSPAAGAYPECMRRLEPELSAKSEARDPFFDLPPREREVANLARTLAPEYGVDPVLALAVIAVESRFHPRALSPKGARGLMQLIPATAERFDVQDAMDVTENLRGGLGYLRWLLAYYRGRLPLVLAAYNAGERAVDRYRGVPPYVETRKYVRQVLGIFRAFEHPFEPRVVSPSAALFGGAQAQAGEAR